METSARSEHEGGDVSDCKDIIGHENKGEIVQGTAGTPDTTSWLSETLESNSARLSAVFEVLSLVSESSRTQFTLHHQRYGINEQTSQTDMPSFANSRIAAKVGNSFSETQSGDRL